MTLNEFYDELRLFCTGKDDSWKLVQRTYFKPYIRSKSGYCPIQQLIVNKNLNSVWDLNMDEEDRIMVMAATDGTTYHKPDIRSKLEEILTPSET